MSALVKLSGTGDVVTRDGKLYAITVDHSAAATCDVRAGGSGGTVILSIRLGAAGSLQWSSAGEGVVCPGGIHVTLSAGTASVEYG